MSHEHHHHDHAAMDSTTASFTTTTGAPMQMDMSGMHHHDHSAMGHSMSFHGGLKEVVLFQFWQTASPLSMILSCIVVVLLCFVMEATRWSRMKREIVNKATTTSDSPVTPHRLIDACLHAVQLTISYLLMLVFMTFNVWLCVATVCGEVIARLLFTCFLPVEGAHTSAETSCCT
ncbi:hypothetical protein PRIPAC_89698 [Pristionchus pacificus]|uniref:Copper transport protein n=1 Tax=Pristionchus pacificus TaxID=54126 RepID=A0A2A6CWY0_PRIPA|nr:hypothetical protein PRIPAC_89698 [Pristionchus pacificus]|eukprot:PDM82600.1 hypothetical protein PRIPAC_36993 [Pristionchus pacificus]